MTIVESFPTSIVPERDRPAWCPPWCRAHSAQYAADFGTFKSAGGGGRGVDGLAQPSPPHRPRLVLGADSRRWPRATRSTGSSVPDAAEGYDLAIEAAADGRWNALTPVHLSLHEPAAHMTGAEARQLAAYLIRAARPRRPGRRGHAVVIASPPRRERMTAPRPQAMWESSVMP